MAKLVVFYSRLSRRFLMQPTIIPVSNRQKRPAGKGKTVHPFCTHEGSGLSGTERKIQGVCKGAVVTKGLAVQGGTASRAGAAVEKWV